ncbi:hypothetical protein EVAR_70155_1 [Eumeta japonica]|uniref:Protein Jumonji n=1 Tax=Eumeta variegata TaxID=151549 RepID=A0A4C2A4X3_EUMVA|nr:hypothetical protein EVAR_70155_1 [Eumeta japonica]
MLFLDIHPHKEPVVLLEKWDDKLPIEKTLEKEDDHYIRLIEFVPKVAVDPSGNTKTKAISKSHLKIKRKPIKTLKNNMRLRSRVINTSKPIFPTQRELKFFKQKLSSHVMKRRIVRTKICAPKSNKINLRKRPIHGPTRASKIVMDNKRKVLKRKPSVVSEFSSEDETPLKLYNLAKKESRSVEKNKEKSYQLRSNRVQSPIESTEKTELQKGLTEKTLNPKIANELKSSPKVAPIETELQNYTQTSALTPENKNSGVAKELIVNIVKGEENKLSETFYSDKEIERWMNNSLTSSENEDNFKTSSSFKQNLKKVKIDKNEKPKLLCTDEEQMQPSTSSSTESFHICPSAALENVKTAEEASKVDLNNSCKSCDICKKLDRIVNIVMGDETLNETDKPVGEIELPSVAEDVYNFDSEKDVIKDNQTFTHFRNKRRKSGNDLCNDEKHYLYLDLLPPNSSHVIQLVTVKVPNQNTPIMRARLIPKSEVNQSNDDNQKADEVVVVMGQGNFMDELMSKLTASSKEIKVPDKVPPNLPSAIAMTENHKAVNENHKIPKESQKLLKEACRSQKDSQKHQKESNKSLKESQKVQKDSQKIQKESQKSQKDSHKFAKDNQKGFPRVNESAQLVDAPTFYPTSFEFENPLAYIEKIGAVASKYGLCKIVPPEGFKPECCIEDDIVFTAGNQYPGKMYTRWGPATRELCAIKKYLATQNVCFKRLPLINGVEVNLPKLYHIVQKAGGLKEVIEKKKWQKLAEDMNFQKSNHVDKKLDHVYVRYLLPYDVLTNRERQSLLASVEKGWNKKYKKMLERARNPLHRQKRILGESSSDEEDDAEENSLMMQMIVWSQVASTSMQMYFPQTNSPTPQEVEEEYWRLVLLGNDHICVYTASVDTGEEGYGFTKAKDNPYSKHPWNLKVLTNNPSSVLRSLGSVLSVTTPTLHLGMVFTTSCWHRDPHGLPWIEYLHTGAPKIWYGIPDEQSSKFRRAVETLGPAYCQNKSIWLPSDITMIPPNLLIEHNVSLSKLSRNPGRVHSCEPTMFSLEQLLISMACHWRVAPSVLLQVHSILNIIIQDETSNRRRLQQLKLESHAVANLAAARKWTGSTGRYHTLTEYRREEAASVVGFRPVSKSSGSPHPFPSIRYFIPSQKAGKILASDWGCRCPWAAMITYSSCKVHKNPPKRKTTIWNVREQAECDICRTTLYLSQVVGLNGKSLFAAFSMLSEYLRCRPTKGETSPKYFLNASIQ